MTSSPASPMTSAMRMQQKAAAAKRNRVRDVETLEGDVPVTDAERRQRGGSKVEHTTSPLIKLYRPVAQGYYIPTAIPAENVLTCMEHGYLEACPDCGTTDCTEDPNSCAGRPAIPYRTCPVAGCNEGRGKRVYDNPMMALADEIVGAPGQIVDDAYTSSSAEQRTKVLLDRHILQCHPAEASIYMVTAVVQPPRRPAAGVDLLE